jgi:hypothetical protein
MKILGQTRPPGDAGRAATRRPRRRRVHRTRSDSDHLRWSPNFYTSIITTCTTFFITGTKSKDGRKWPEITPKADRIPPRVCRRISAVRRRLGSGLVALSSWGRGLQNPVSDRSYGGRKCRRWRRPSFSRFSDFPLDFSPPTSQIDL